MPIGERPSSRLVLAGLIALSLAAAGWWALRSSRNPSSVPLDRNLTELTRQVAAIEEAERKVDATVWKEEILAQECGRVWEHLWDAINASTNKLAVLGQLAADQIVPPQLGEPESLPYGIGIHAQVGLGPAWTLAGWKSFLAGKAARGWQLSQIEFRHVGFEVDAQGRPARSRLAAAAHLDNPRERRRAILQGELLVDWAGRTSQAHRVETKGLTVRTRVGEPPFEEILAETVIPPAGSYFIDPVILYDLDGDGVSEIILAARNVVYHWTSTGKFEWTPLCRYPPGLIFTGILGDFDGDRAVDFLCAKFTGLALFKGSSRGTFDEPEQLVWSARPHLKYAQALTCGDVDGDGDLDIWLGQYKVPYDRGQMPTPYYDANDGHPSYLLLNDGQGLSLIHI